MDKKENVKRLEKVLNEQISLLEQLEAILDKIEGEQAAYQTLLDYYDSPLFMEDVQFSNKGYFDGIPCGILSEDGIYNHIFERRQVAERLVECAALLRES